MTRRVSVLADEGEENLDWSLDRVLERNVDACVQTFVHFDFHLEWQFPFKLCLWCISIVTSLSETPLKLMWSWELTASLRSTMTCKRRFDNCLQERYCKICLKQYTVRLLL